MDAIYTTFKFNNSFYPIVLFFFIMCDHSELLILEFLTVFSPFFSFFFLPLFFFFYSYYFDG